MFIAEGNICTQWMPALQNLDGFIKLATPYVTCESEEGILREGCEIDALAESVSMWTMRVMVGGRPYENCSASASSVDICPISQ